MAEEDQQNQANQQDNQPIIFDKAEAQRILCEAQLLYDDTEDPSRFLGEETLENLENDRRGPQLSYKECAELCSKSFVKEQIFNRTGRAKNQSQHKLSDLAHVDMARVLLRRHVQVYRTMPNHNQVATFFVQQVYCFDILQSTSRLAV